MSGRLPDFIIVGFQKCGTTSLAFWLREHPQAYVVPRKELDFFTLEENWSQGVDWYASKFAEAGDAKLCGEGTPHYINFPRAIRRMRDVVPQAKLIVCLRDPVERAYSSWRHTYMRVALDRRPFDVAIRTELEKRPGPPGDEPCDYTKLRYTWQGLYAEQLERLCRVFPREQVHILFMEDLAADKAAVYSEVCRFLDIDDTVEPPEEYERVNVNGEIRPFRLWQFQRRYGLLDRMPERLRYPLFKLVFHKVHLPVEPMNPETRALLEDYYAEPDRRLAEWLGRELPWQRARRSAAAPSAS